jgi:hypothetical protein
MNSTRHDLRIGTIWTLVLVLLTLAACQPQITSPSVSGTKNSLALPAGTNVATDSCQGCSQATLKAAALTQANIDADAFNAQASATAAIVQANQKATDIAANSTKGVALTQVKENANAIQAQVAATGEINRANGLATLNAANSTQSAALVQDAIRQTQAQFNLESTLEQQNKDQFAAGTQTVVANFIATQTESAVATTQWYTDQSRQREEQRQRPIAFLWMWCLPIFVVLFAGLCLWGFWRWLKIQQNRQRMAEQSIENQQAPVDPSEPQDKFLEPGSDIVNGRYRLTQPDDQMRGWLDEIKRKLLNREKDKDDDSDG